MTIRKASSQDLSQLSILFNSYRVFYRKDPDIPATSNFLKERLTKEDSKIYVCENNEKKLIGFVQLYPLFSSTKMKQLWLLNDLFVDANFRGLGISLKLIQRAKKLVRETKACGMYLETEKTNTIGNTLYPKAGFELNKVSNFYEWFVN